MTVDNLASKMEYDYHAHSTFSDGSEMETMIEAAQDVGLDGIGFADHCNVSIEEPGMSLAWDLDETYPERRRKVQTLREEFDLRIFDAVEMDYRPEDEERIETFLGEADFDYTLGSVHHVGTRDVAAPTPFSDEPDEVRRQFVDRYFELVVELIESELFDVVAHLDLTERNANLRTYATEEHYRAVAAALATSSTVPELNAGRVFSDYGEVHPHPEFLEVLLDEGIPFVPGTDSHLGDEVGRRTEYISENIREWDIQIVDPL